MSPRDFTILIVDDNANNLFTLRMLLSRLPQCRIVEADSGEEALIRTIEEDVDMILLDVQMPGMDGFETAEHLRMTGRTRNIPIIFVTAVFKGEEFVKRGYAIGAVDYLTKPIDDNLLLNRVALYRKLTEREHHLMEALDAAEAANRAKSSFLANMSHELRTPMNAIMGMTDQALRRATDEKQKDQLTKVAKASQRLLTLINDILDISKIEAERLDLDKIDFKLGDVIEKLNKQIGSSATEKDLKFKIDVSSDMANLYLRGDPLRLEQILFNLVSNAIKYTPEGMVSVRVLLAEDNSNDVLLRFEVRDTGIGISNEDQTRLFNVFEQADASMSRKYGGTGLGLSISKRLAQLMGGSIGVESELGSGSLFWFTARLIKIEPAFKPLQAQDSFSAEAQLKAHYSGARLLLAEDEPINREVLRDLLEETGFKVDLAEDGAEAVEMAKHTRYDLILMVLQMPKLNGIEATRALRAMDGFAQAPILALTSHELEEEFQGYIEAGMNDRIVKPIDPDRLFVTLHRWLSRS